VLGGRFRDPCALVKLEVRYIPLSLLRRRPDDHWTILDIRRAQEIAANFDINAFRPLRVISDGEDGYFVWDGRHRLLAIQNEKFFGDGEQMVPCYISLAAYP